MTKRRTKLEMKWMREDVSEYLMRTNNDAHKAWDLFIKEHLESGSCLPHYIKGNKDFVKVAEELKYEIEAKQAEKERKQQVKANKEQIIETLHTMTIDQFKAVYKQYKDIVSHNDKLNLNTIMFMIMENDFHGFDESLLNTIVRNNIELLPVENEEVTEEVTASVETVNNEEVSPAILEEKFMNDDYITKNDEPKNEDETVIKIPGKSLNGYGKSVWINDNRKHNNTMTYYNPKGNESIAIRVHRNDYDKYWSIEKFIFGIMKEYGNDNEFWEVLIRELNDKYVNVSCEIKEHKENKPVKQPRENVQEIAKVNMIAAYAKINYIGDSVHVVFNNDKVNHTVKYKYRRSWSHRKYIDKALNDTGIKPGWDFRYGWEYAETNDKEVMLQ